jgi:hypothetical protein
MKQGKKKFATDFAEFQMLVSKLNWDESQHHHVLAPPRAVLLGASARHNGSVSISLTVQLLHAIGSL